MFTTSDPLHRSVTLKSSTWYNKIINTTGANDNCEHGNSHIEMESLLDEVKRTIENPNIIVKDLENVGVDEDGNEIIKVSDTREEYFRIYVNTTESCLNAVKVVVGFDDEHKIGEVVTTHKMNGKLSKVSTKGGVVYDSNKQ